MCGLPLFTIEPADFAVFQADTLEHGWPSFRPDQVIDSNVKLVEQDLVVSSCGTHLGSNVPDERGTRYCLDLSCVAGNAQ